MKITDDIPQIMIKLQEINKQLKVALSLIASSAELEYADTTNVIKKLSRSIGQIEYCRKFFGTKIPIIK